MNNEVKIKHHHPAKLNVSGLGLDYNIFGEALAEATLALGHLDGSLKKLQNPQLLVSPLTAKEATISSSIEGTQSTVSDVFLLEAGGTPKYSDTLQVKNYRSAINFATDEVIKGRPLTQHLIKTLHQILLSGVRHVGKLGQFRDDRVWIAERRGDPIEKALYIPPEHILVNDYAENLLDYIAKGKEHTLIKSGIVHYQFEAVHPFEDGNGRIGRLLIPLVLFCGDKLSRPILYASGYFEAHRDEYMLALRDVDKSGRYENWLLFYFKSVTEQLRETQKLIDDIYFLYDKTKNHFPVTKSPYLSPFIDFMFKYPNFTKPMVKQELKIESDMTVNRLVSMFVGADLVKSLKAKHHRAKIYSYYPLLNLLA